MWGAGSAVAACGAPRRRMGAWGLRRGLLVLVGVWWGAAGVNVRLRRIAGLCTRAGLRAQLAMSRAGVKARTKF